MVDEFLTRKAALASEDPADQTEQARGLLWLYLLHVVQNDGNLYPADSFAQRLRDQHKATKDVFSSSSSSSPMPPLQFPTSLEPQMQLAGQAVEDLMLNGQFHEACQCALDAELWDVALMLAYTKAHDMWQAVSLGYVQSRFDRDSPSSTLMHVLAGHSDKIFDGDGLADWREKLSLLLQSTTGQESAATISALADKLHVDGQLFGAHLCWLLCGVNELDALGPDAKMSLVGVDGRRKLTLASMLMTIQMTEVYEYSRRQLDSTYSMPSFQTYKLMYVFLLSSMVLQLLIRIVDYVELQLLTFTFPSLERRISCHRYACVLAEMGDLRRARQYCDSIVQTVAALGEGYFAPSFVERLRDLQSQVYGECELVENALGEATKRQTEAARQAYQQQQQAQYAYEQALAEQARQAQAQGFGQVQMQPDGHGGYFVPQQPQQAEQSAPMGSATLSQASGGTQPPPPSPQEGSGTVPGTGNGSTANAGGVLQAGGDQHIVRSKSILGGLGNILSQTISSVTSRCVPLAAFYTDFDLVSTDLRWADEAVTYFSVHICVRTCMCL